MRRPGEISQVSNSSMVNVDGTSIVIRDNSSSAFDVVDHNIVLSSVF